MESFFQIKKTVLDQRKREMEEDNEEKDLYKQFKRLYLQACSQMLALHSHFSAFIKKNMVRALLFLTTLFFTLNALLVSEISRTMHRHQPSEAVSVSFLFEVTKLLISASFFFIERRSNKADLLVHFDLLEFLKYSIPALLYLLNEQIIFIAIALMDAVTFELLSNLRILLTAFFLSWFLKKRLNNVQVPALLLLVLGTAVSQWVTCNKKITSTATLPGVFWTLVYSTFSAAAGVYTEHLLKHNKKQSVHFQNIQLYAHGTLFSFLGLLTIFYEDWRSLSHKFPFFCFIF